MTQTVKMNELFSPAALASQVLLKHSLNFECLPPLISWLDFKFDDATLCVLNRSLVSQNFALKSYLYQKFFKEKPLGGRVGSTPPPPTHLDWEGLTFSDFIDMVRNNFPLTHFTTSFLDTCNPIKYTKYTTWNKRDVIHNKTLIHGCRL